MTTLTLFFMFSLNVQFIILASSCPDIFVIKNINWKNAPENNLYISYNYPADHFNGEIN